jgi:dolichol-phosphate mannosyltransferase
MSYEIYLVTWLPDYLITFLPYCLGDFLMKVSVILPTYCERDNIGDLISAIQAVMAPEDWETEILVVDDNSPDGTAQVVRDCWGAQPAGQPDLWMKNLTFQVFCHVRTEERGLATAIKYGILQSTGEIIVVMDTDFNHDPRMIPQMVKFLEFYDLITGSRFVMGGGMEDRTRYYYSLFYNLFVRMLLRLQVQDNLSGFFAIRREKLLALNMDRIFQGYGEYLIRMLHSAWNRQYRMLEVPVFYILRRHGQSKSRFLSMLKDYSGCVFSLWLHGKELLQENGITADN